MHSLKVSLGLLSSAIALSGCAVGPDYHPPRLDSPKGFVADAALMQREGARPADLERWWDGFGDPLLARFVSEAQQRNLDVAQAIARVQQSRASLRSASAALLPSGAVTAQAGRVQQSTETPLGALSRAADFGRDADVFEGDLTAAWEIDLFGGLRRGQEAARDQYQAAQADAIASRLSVAAQTADTYVVIRGLQARLEIAREQVATQQRLVNTVSLQYRKGIAAELQLRQAEGALSQVEAAVPVLEAALVAAANALDILLAEQPGTCIKLLDSPAPIPAAPSISGAGGPADLLRRRPDLIVAERRLAASNAQIGQAIAEYYPKFSLSGLLGTATIHSGNLFGGAATQAQGFLGLRWRLFDFGRVDAEIAAARGRNVEALAAYRLAVLRASGEVEDSFTALAKREDQARILANGEGSLSRARDASTAAYKGGVVSLIEVLDADARLLATRDARAQAQTEAARAAISSFRALGGGWSAPVAG